MKKYSKKLSFLLLIFISLFVGSCLHEQGLSNGYNEISPKKIAEQNARMEVLVRQLENELNLPSGYVKINSNETGHREIQESEWADLETKLRNSLRASKKMSQQVELRNELNRIRNEQLAEAWSKCSNKRDSFAAALKFPDIVSFDAAGYEELGQLGLWPPKANDRKN